MADSRQSDVETPAPGQGDAARWDIRLLGGFEARSASTSISHLPSRACLALLARLALWPERDHAREELVELLWPGVDLAVGRNRLRQVLSTLRALLEPPGQGPVIVADRRALRVAPGALGCDALRFERALRQGQPQLAAGLYRGELLPGLFDEWIHAERLRLAALAEPLGDGGPGRGPAAGAAPGVTPPRPVLAAPRRGAPPSYLTRCFGIEAQAARLRSVLLHHRLVTLLGPGGIGKTRLAVELVHTLRETPDLSADDLQQVRFERIAFVAAAGCGGVDSLLDAMAQSLGLEGRAERLQAQLAAALQHERALVVVDNVEQLLPAAAGPLAWLLGEAPQLHLLCTSRRVLGIDGEQEFRLLPLGLSQADAPLAQAAACPAVALFVDRARATRPDFHLGPRNVEAVAGLVQALGGLPLAIELAAARVRSLSPAELLQRLTPRDDGGRGGGLALLQRSGPRAAHDHRHASMEQVIAWSWALLPGPVQSLLERLTPFVSGFEPDAAVAVGAADAESTLAAVDEAVQHSLLQVEPGAGAGGRLRLDEPVREFALGRLDAAAGLEARRAFRAHWQRWALALDATPPLARVRREMGNLVAAIGGAVDDGEPDAGVRLAVSLAVAFDEVTLSGHGYRQLQRAVRACTDATLEGQGLVVLASAAVELGVRDEAEAHAARSLQLIGRSHPGRPRALAVAAYVTWTVRRDAAVVRQLLDEGEPLATAAGDAAALAALLGVRAYSQHIAAGDPAAAEALFERVVDLRQRAGNRHALRNARYHQANLRAAQGELERAARGFERVRDDGRADDDLYQLCMACDALGGVLARRRDWQGALLAFRESAEAAWAEGNRVGWLYTLWNAPEVLVRRGEPAAAQQLLGHAAAAWTRDHGELTADDRRHLVRIARLAAVGVGRPALPRLAEEGRAWTPTVAMLAFRTAVERALGQPSPLNRWGKAASSPVVS